MSAVDRDIHQQRLMVRARELGLAVEDLAPTTGIDLVRYTWRGQVELVRRGRVFSHLSAVSERLCDDKVACKGMLEAAGIPVPRGTRFRDADTPEVEALLSSGGSWVVKPVVGSHGDGVCLGVRTVAEVWEAMGLSFARDWLIEEEIPGEDLRIQAVSGVLLAACCREPASIVGNGRMSVRELIDDAATAVRRNNHQNDLRIDAEVRAHLAGAGLDLDSVPTADHRVCLRSTANMANGGRAVDLTGRIHPDWHEVVRRIANALSLSVFAVDAVTPDPERSPFEIGAVIEVNARSEWLHHTFSEGRQHDVPRALLEALFGRLGRP